MARRRPGRVRRYLGYSLLTIVALLLLALGALATPPGRALVAGMIERGAAGSGVTVSIENLTGWLPFSLGADKIVLSDADGQFAEIDGLAVDIHTSALFVGSLSLDAIDATRVSVLREPHLPGGKSGSGGALLPFAARNVKVARLELGEAFAGRPAVLALTGSLVSGADGGLAAKVDANRIDGGTATLAATLARVDGNAPITAAVTLKESADGILPGLMGRQSGPAYALDAKVASRGDALTGNLSLISGGSAHFTGQFVLSPAGAGTHLTLNGSGNLAELVPPDYASLLAGPINVAVDADWAAVKGESLPHIVLRQGEIATDSVHASASGTLGGNKTDLSLKANVAMPAGGAIALPFLGSGAGMESLSLSGKAASSGNAVRLDVVGHVVGLKTTQASVPGIGLSLAVEAPQGVPLAGGSLRFGMRVEADAIETATGHLASTKDAPLLLTADGTFDTATGIAKTQARLAGAGGAVTFNGTAAAGAVKGRATIGFPNIAPLSPLAGRALGGALDATIDGTLAGSEPAFTLDGTASDLDPGDARLASLFAGDTKFAASVHGQSGGGFAVSDLAIDGTGITARGSASLGADTVEARLDGSLADLGRLADKSEGAATFTLHASGATARPDMEATVAIAEGRLLDQPVRNAKVDLKGTPTDAGWQAALGLGGSLGGGRLAGTAIATVSRSDGAVAFPKVDLSVGKNRITGAIESTTAGLLSGTLTLDAPDLRSLAALALVPASGRAQASVQLQPDGDSQSVAVRFNGADITWQDIAAGAIDGTMTITDLFGTPKVRGDASASAVNVGGRRLDTVKAAATGEGGATRIEASARGPDIDLSTVVRLADAAVTIDTLKGTAFGTPVGLSQPVTIALDGGTTRVVGATLTLGGGSVRVEGAVSPQIDLTVNATTLAASVVNGFSPGLGAEGSLSGRARITGTPSSPTIDWQADWTGFALAATRGAGLPALAINASGKSTITASTVAARLSGAGLALAVDGQVPFSGPGLDVKANGTVPLALLTLSSGRELRLAGNAKVNVAVGGALAAPAMTGAVDLVDATIVDGETGFGISGASGRIDFDGRKATVEKISGRFPQGGTVDLAGSVTTDQSDLPADLTLRVSNGRYADGNTVNTTFSGDLAVKGPLLGNGVVSGTINLGRTEIQLSDRMAGSANAIEVRHVNTSPDFVAPIAPANPDAGAGSAPAGGGLNLDISLAANSGLYVRGFGIDAELGGSLKVGGTSRSPQAVGGFQMQRGRMDAIGRRFTFTTGTLTFSGSLVPIVDFAATTQTSDAVVTLNVTGPATDPQISLTSSPSLPEEEILSRLLFNQGVGTLSAAQAIQLVDAVGQLTGASGGGIVSRIRSATGLDDLDIRQGASGGTTVGVGKRINDNIRLGVEAGTNADSGRVTIDLNITKHLKAQGSAGQDGSGQVGLTYEREY